MSEAVDPNKAAALQATETSDGPQQEGGSAAAAHGCTPCCHPCPPAGPTLRVRLQRGDAVVEAHLPEVDVVRRLLPAGEGEVAVEHRFVRDELDELVARVGHSPQG